MTTIRKIVTSKIDGSNADNTDISEIRPFGETAFYIDNNGEGNRLTLMMFDGVRTHQKSKVLSPGVLYGSNADSGDGGGYDTIKLVPDAALGSDQYIVVDPTGGEPGHIHLRAGGTQDASGADLYLGGELTCVRVSDTSDIVTIRTTQAGDPAITKEWQFSPDGNLYLPSFGETNYSIGESEPGLVLSSSQGVAFLTNSMADPTMTKDLIFGNDGKLRLNGAEINATSPRAQVGSIISIPLNAAGDTVDYTGGASVIEVPTNADTNLVQAGWIITFNGGVQRTVSSAGVTGEYTSIYFSEANPGGTLYPLTIQSAEYVAAAEGAIRLTPDPFVGNPKTWTFSETGSLTTPGGGIISHENNDLKLEVSGTDVIVLHNAGGDFVFNTNGSLTFPNDARLAPADRDIAIIAGNDGSTYGSVGIITAKPAASYTVVQQYSPYGTDVISTTIAETPDIASIVAGMTVTGAGITVPTTVASVTGPDEFGTYLINLTPAVAAELPYLETYTFVDAEAEPITNAWAFNSTGSMIFPNDVRITLGGQMDQNAINFSVPDSVASSTYYEWSFDASYGMPFLRFPDNTLQSTAWAGGRVVEAPIASTGAEGDKEGDLAFANDYIYRCVADYTDGQSNIWKRIAWSGDTW